MTDSCALDQTAFSEFAKSRGSVSNVQKLLILSGMFNLSIECSFWKPRFSFFFLCFCADKLKSRQTSMSSHFKVLAALTYTDKEKMDLIINSFKDCLDLNKFDEDPNPDFANKVIMRERKFTSASARGCSQKKLIVYFQK